MYVVIHIKCSVSIYIYDVYMYIILFNVLIYVCIVCVCYVNFIQVRNVHFLKGRIQKKKESQSYILYTSLIKK